jgi:glycosyltransferase involved in cell wall biosynthesis
LNVWDNGSTDGTKEYLRSLFDNNKFNCGILFDCKTNFGTAIAKNNGMKAINAKYIFITDDDMYHNERCIEGLVNTMDEINKYHYESCAILGTYHPFHRVRYMNTVFLKKVVLVNSVCHKVKIIPPGAWYVDRDIMGFIGGFKLPKGKLMGYTAWHMPEKLRKAGYQIFYLSSYLGKNISSKHMDNIKHKLNFIDYYEQTGYNEFRRKQKGL